MRPRIMGDTNPAWVKAPLLLLRFPGIFAAVLAAAIILGVASVASPIFLSSAGSAALEKQRSTVSRQGQGLKVISYSSLTGEAWREQDALLNQAVAPIPHVEPRILTILGSIANVTTKGTPPRQAQVRLLTRTGFEPEIVQISSVDGPGVWISDTTAKQLRLRAGDSLSIAVRRDTADVRVKGIYRHLVFAPPRPYWNPIRDLIYPADIDVPVPPPFLLAEEGSFVQLARQLRDFGEFRWEYWVSPQRLTLQQGQDVAARLSVVEADLDDPVSTIGRELEGATHQSFLPTLVENAVQTVGALQGAVDTLALAGRLVALVVLGAVGIYAVHKRRVEMGLLSARGVSPWGVGGKSALETLLPAAAGAALGWFLGTRLIRMLGPSDLISPSAVDSALRQVVWSTIVAILLVGLVTAVAVRGEAEGRAARIRGAVARSPWEIAVLALAAAAFYEISTRGTTTVSSSEGPPTVDVFLLLFPMLFVAGGAGLATRVLRRWLPALRAAGTRRSSALYLASRRLASASRMALLLVTASALSIGILTYAGTLSSSVEETANAKALVFSGGDVAITLVPNAEVPSLPFPATRVSRIQGPTSILPGDISADVLGIDRATFAGAAFWRNEFAGQPLESLIAKLGPVRAGRLPVILAGTGFPPQPVLALASYRIPMEPVAEVSAFPGMSAQTQLVVADVSALGEAFSQQGTSLRGVGAVEQLWARGEPARVISGLRAAGVRSENIVTAEDIRSSPALLALSWTFGFLKAIGVMTGLVVLVGLLLYLQARQRAREVSYALARRMGLRRWSHLVSVALELMGMLLAALVMGVSLAALASRLTYAKLDPIPGIPPAPLLRFPLGLLGLTVVALFVAAWIGSIWVQRAADRANVAEVMRAAG